MQRSEDAAAGSLLGLCGPSQQTPRSVLGIWEELSSLPVMFVCLPLQKAEASSAVVGSFHSSLCSSEQRGREH